MRQSYGRLQETKILTRAQARCWNRKSGIFVKKTSSMEYQLYFHNKSNTEQKKRIELTRIHRQNGPSLCWKIERCKATWRNWRGKKIPNALILDIFLIIILIVRCPKMFRNVPGCPMFLILSTAAKNLRDVWRKWTPHLALIFILSVITFSSLFVRTDSV